MSKNREKLLNGSIIYLVLTVLEKGGWLLLLPFYTHYLNPEQFGQYTLYLLFLSFFIILASFSLHNAVGKIYYDIRDGRYNSDLIKFEQTLYSAIFLASITLSTVVFALGKMLLYFFEDYNQYQILLFLLCINVLSVPLVDVYKSFFQVKQQALNFAKVSLFQFILSSIISVVFILYFDFKLIGLVSGMLIAQILIFGFVFFKKIIQQGFYIEKKLLKYCFSYSLPLIPHQLSNWVIRGVDRLMIQVFASLSALGIYALAVQLSSVVAVLVSSVNMAWSPVMYEHIQKGEEGKVYLSEISSICMLVLYVIAGGMLFFAKYVIIYFFDVSYADVIYYLPPLILVSVLSAIHVFIAAPLVVSKPKLFSIITIISAMTNITFNFILIFSMGAIGAVYATLLQKLLATILYGYFGYKSELKIDFDLITLLAPLIVLVIAWLFFIDYSNMFIKDLILFLIFNFIVFLFFLRWNRAKIML